MKFRGAVAYRKDGFDLYKQDEEKFDTITGAINCATTMLLALNFSLDKITKYDKVSLTVDEFECMKKHGLLRNNIYAGYVEIEDDDDDDGEPIKVVDFCKFKKDKERMYNVTAA